MGDPRSSTVDDIVRRSAQRFGDKVALRFAERQWTYRELDAGVTRAAGHLLSLGLAHGDRVATVGLNSDAYLLAFLGCARAGLVHVPVNFALTGGELEYLLTDSGARVVLVDEPLRAGVEQVRERTALEQVLVLHGTDDAVLPHWAAGEVPTLEHEVDELDLVQLLYTSGTTSAPKGAMMTHRALVHEYVSCLAGLEIAEDDDPLHCMPLYHSAQMHVFLLPSLARGCTNTLLPKPDVAEILRRVAADRHRSLFLAPTVWVPLSNHEALATADLTSLRKAYYGASIMPGPVRDRLAARLPDIGFYNCFGQSEIGPLATVLLPAEHEERPESCGRTVLFVETRVVDEEGADVPAGERGELLYRSPQLCIGYWNKPDETEAAFRDGWFHSGDMVVRDEAGYITVVDRIKDVINTGGVLVASREVEDAVYTHPAVAEVAVVATPDERWIEAVTAVVVRRSGEDVDEAAIIAHARTSLASYKVPKKVVFVDELPRNQSGKLLKRVLRDRLDA
ncbi:fatty acyl-CoA synthetase [Nostocoides sp. Soil756]|jgi:fatty-acyl-CoA synthase|uniref:fatty acyl-CoA synthetase n=1 Tax=Nostocoides sp. Soil756 TaxID=1736399 RepID=UPI0006F385B5|nr:fatty acyl-CoA synthetase [Tetrasphaera sp. Soil756]KRE63395.1 acyl-CoA synthetase [Tetrasphaera sp. Soil756]